MMAYHSFANRKKCGPPFRSSSSSNKNHRIRFNAAQMYISCVMDVNKVYDELHVNLLSLLFYLRVHLPFHRYSRSINNVSTIVHAHAYTLLLLYYLPDPVSLPFLGLTSPPSPFSRHFPWLKRKDFFSPVKLSYHRKSEIHQFLHIVSKGISKHKWCAREKKKTRRRIKFHV